MGTFRILLFAFMAIATLACKAQIAAPKIEFPDRILWYRAPAENWDNALPVGNGRLGAMVFGNPLNERIQLNEDSMWPGGTEWGMAKGTPEDLKEIRNLIKNGDVHLADSLLVERFSYKWVTMSHQTMGDLFISYEEKAIDGYTRELNMSKAVVSANYKAGGYEVTQKVFSSAADDVLVIKISTTDPEGLNYKLKLSRPDDKGHPTVVVSTPANNMIKMTGMVTQYGGVVNSMPVAIDHGVKFETLLQVQNSSGSVNAISGGLSLEKVRDATIFIVCNTSFYSANYKDKNIQTLKGLNALSYETVLKGILMIIKVYLTALLLI
ncbi:MAG: glycoside hydrolase family 95 protein [Flavobacteriaceae bacterium]|nr:glycoside hydrolase family 95 protein [Flavobacteriaceae bacterium]